MGVWVGVEGDINILLMLNGTKIHPHNKHGIFGKNDMENAHDIMKTKTSEDSIWDQRLGEKKTGKKKLPVLYQGGHIYCDFNFFLVLSCVFKLSVGSWIKWL